MGKVEHVVLKNVKRELRYAKEAKVFAGMPRASIDAGHLEWLIQRAEENEKLNAEIADREESHIQLYHRMTVAEDRVQELESEIEDMKLDFLVELQRIEE